MDNHFSENVEHDFVLSYLSSLNCSRSLAVAIMYRHREYFQIVNLDFNPRDYNSFDDARDSLLATELLRKHADLETDIDLDDACLTKFFASEESCKKTNELFFSAALLPNYHILLNARRKIEKILGEFLPDEFLDNCCWGPGSTLHIKRREATFANKFRRKSEITLASYQFVKTWFASQFPNWEPNFSIYEGNKIITVPKNAKTNRVIAVEPSVNLFMQKGVGSMIRKRLRKFGVDLNDQTRNQKLAQKASLDQRLATIDFSAASDTISYWLVDFLLPKRWFDVLNILRCPRGHVQDSIIEYEKFSSMGNGFTFELESLIFYAIAIATVGDGTPDTWDVSIYGDDLICPSKYKDLLIEVFDTCGFSINRSKTFFDGYYRESCGHHYWNGLRICPTYVRCHPSTKVELIKVHNQTVRTHACQFGFESKGVGFTNTINNLRNLLRRQRVPFVPPHFGDVGLVVPLDVAQPKWIRDESAWEVFILEEKKRSKIEDDRSYLLEKLLVLHLGRDAVGLPFNSVNTGNKRAFPNGDFVLKRTSSRDWPCLSVYFHSR